LLSISASYQENLIHNQSQYISTVILKVKQCIINKHTHIHSKQSFRQL